MDDPILGMEAEEEDEGERYEVIHPPLALTHHVSAMVMRRFKLREEEVQPFIEHHLLLAGPGRKRRDGALRWTSEERVQVVTREYPHCTLVLTCYPLPRTRTWQKDKKVRRKPGEHVGTKHRRSRQSEQEHLDS